MYSSFDTSSCAYLDRRVSPNPYRHARNFSNQSIFSISSYASDLSSTLSSTTHSSASMDRKPPKYRLLKLIKSSLKYTIKTNKIESNNIEYWNTFYKKLRKITIEFNDSLSLYNALNEPFSGKSSNKTCSSIIHILCKQLYLYARSNNWSVCFKILDCITLFLDGGANTFIFYTKLSEPPQYNYNSIHTLYEGLQIMLSSNVITHEQFVSYFSRAISGNYYNNNNDIQPEPAVLTLCFYINNKQKCDNITYWMGDCSYNDYYIYLISPYLASSFILMGYDLIHICLFKLNHLNYNNKQMDLLIRDEISIKTILTWNDKTQNKINNYIISFLWFIRFGNFKKDLINIVDIGIKQLVLNEFIIEEYIILEILSYSHYFIIKNTEYISNKLNLSYFNENEWMIRAFESLFKLDNIWIEWITKYVLPQLTKIQLNKIRKYLLNINNISNKQWNKIIGRISLKTIVCFSKYHILPANINTIQMQNIIIKHYKNDNLIQFLISGEYDIIKTFGTNSILYNILNDHSMENIQLDNIINTIHFRIQKLIIQNKEKNINAARIIISNLLFSQNEWKINQTIWQNIKLVFNPKYNHFCLTLNDLLYKLLTIQNHYKFIFFMKNNMFDFQYCVNKGLISIALQNLLNEQLFNKKPLCIKLMCDWIYNNFINENDINRKNKIAKIIISCINSYMANILSLSLSPIKPEKDQVIIEQYLYELKAILNIKNIKNIKSKPSLILTNDSNNFIPLGFYYFKSEISYRKINGVLIFTKLLKNRQQLIHQMNWDMLVDTIYLNLDINSNDYIIILKALKMVAENLNRKHNKYRTLYTNNKTVQQRILSRIGGCEFLLGLGFIKVTKQKLICDNVDFHIVATAISAISAKLPNVNKSDIINGPKEIQLCNNNIRNAHWTSMIKIVK